MGWYRKDKLCGNCRFWALSRMPEADGDEPKGLQWEKSDCRRHAPGLPTIKVITEPRYNSGDLDGSWPQTKLRDWCGDFERGAQTLPPKASQ